MKRSTVILTLFQVDAFSDRPFGGNPAAVCPLPRWIDADMMQAIAAENNLAETAFVVPVAERPGEDGNRFEIRWFTPRVEVDLCGHATLAATHVLLAHVGVKAAEIHFHSHLSGELSCRHDDAGYTLNFPVDDPCEKEPVSGLADAIGATPETVWRGSQDYMLVYREQADVASLRPDFGKLTRIDTRGVIVTAPGRDCDFVSRFFAPALGIDEDPVTGSAHTMLTPYWHRRLASDDRPSGALQARQISERGGSLSCQLHGNRVLITGQAVTYLTGEIRV